MATIRERNGKFQAIIIKKRGGVIIHREARTFASRRLAKDWAERVSADIAVGGVRGRVVARADFADLVEKYQAQRAAYKPLQRSVLADLGMLRQEVGAVRLSDLTAEVFVRFATRRASRGAGPATILHNLSMARAVLNAAKPMFDIDIDASPVTAAMARLKMIGAAGKAVSRSRRPTSEELSSLIAEFERIANHPATQIPMATIVRLAVVFPRRIGELCSMAWTDYADGVMLLRDTKHPRMPRTEKVPVPREAREIIDALPVIDARILPYNPDSCSAAFTRACQRLNIHDLHLHDLRHEGVSRLFEAGLAIPEVALISGHMSWANLKRYTHLSPRHVLEKLDARPQAQ